jgi:hypothetical protein
VGETPLQRFFHSVYGGGQCAAGPKKIHPRNGRSLLFIPQGFVLTYSLPEIILFHYGRIYSRTGEKGRIFVVDPFAGSASAVGDESHGHDLSVKKLQNG